MIEFDHTSMAQQLACFHSDNPLESYAARELARYVALMTGVRPRLRSAKRLPVRGTDFRPILSVGRSVVTNALIENGGIRLPHTMSGEGFLLKSASFDGREVLVFCGGAPRGTLNAVNHYLESFCRVGFFWDGDRVPAVERIPFEGIEVWEEPRWPERQYLASVACDYSAWWWGWKEWKREIDWAVRHRFNLMGSPPGAVAVWVNVWKRFGTRVSSRELSGPPFLAQASARQWSVRPPYPPRFQRFMHRLTVRMLRYGRRLGMRWISPSMVGLQVPKRFHEAWRDRSRFMMVPWAQLEPAAYLHPDDPVYVELLRAFVEECRERYGTDHYWWLPTYPAAGEGGATGGGAPGEGAEEGASIARRTFEAVRWVDPQALLVCSGLTFADRRLWPPERVKAFLDALPVDAIRVWDLWEDFRLGSESVPRPQYQELDYYFAKPWLMGFLHSRAGNTSLHGDLAGTVQRAQQVAADPGALHCLGVALQAEVVHHNPLYYDLLCRIAWNPANVTVGGFLKDYAQRRYGAAAAPAMQRSLEELVASVYGTPDITGPLYQLRIEERMLRPEFRYDREPSLLSLADRSRFLPRLAAALKAALDAAAGTLADDKLYQHDLIDIARQYLGDLFNFRIVELYDRFRRGDRTAFATLAREIEGMLDDQEGLLGSSDHFRLEPLLWRARRLRGAPRDYARRVRDMLTAWADVSPDYARRDYYELVRFCYHRRVRALVEHMQARMESGSSALDDGLLKERYQEIDRAFVQGDYDRRRKPAGRPFDAARELLRDHPCPPELVQGAGS